MCRTGNDLLHCTLNNFRYFSNNIIINFKCPSARDNRSIIINLYCCSFSMQIGVFNKSCSSQFGRTKGATASANITNVVEYSTPSYDIASYTSRCSASFIGTIERSHWCRAPSATIANYWPCRNRNTANLKQFIQWFGLW